MCDVPSFDAVGGRGVTIVKKKKKFVHLVLYASLIFVRLEFICLFLCMLLWFYIFHAL